MPTQWRTIAPIVGRTPSQCLERYEKLLDAACVKDENYEPGDDPRKLRPGEIDPNPESKPARPDPVDMDEDEKEMLSEARARLANTRGKKAKRKAREKQLEEARRLASLQKRRELKAAGIDGRHRKRKRKGIDYNAEIPFEKKPPPGFFDVTDEERLVEQPKFPTTIEELEGKRRVDVEAQLRKQDVAKNKIAQRQDAPSAILQANKMNDPETVRKRSKLMLPAPQISDHELEEIAKMGYASDLLAGNEELTEGSGATRALLANYSQTPRQGMTPLRTPQRTPAGTPIRRVSSTINEDMDMHDSAKLELRRQADLRRNLRSGLGSLPQPKNEYQVVIQPIPEDNEEPEEKIEEDMSDRLARERAEEEARQQALLRKRSKVLQRELPRPPVASLDLIRNSLMRADEDKSSFVPPTLIEQADEMIRKELLGLLEHDNAKYPLDEKTEKEKKKGGKRSANGKSAGSVPDIEDFEEAELKERMVRTLKVSMERKTFLVRFEGEAGGKWCSLTEHSRGSVFALGFEKEEVGWLIEHLMKAMEMKNHMGFNRKLRGKTRVHLMEVCFNNHEAIEEALSLHDLRFNSGFKSGLTVLLRRWSPKENSEVVGKFKGGWIELWGLPFHLWSEARVRVVMKERSVLSALIEVLDGGWEFTISVVVVGEEDIRRGREMGESTRQEFEPHSWIGGRKRVEEASSTAVGRSIEGAVGRMKKGRVSQMAEIAPVGTRGKRGPTDGEVWAGGDKAQSTGEKGLRVSKQVRRAHSSLKPKPQIEVDLGWKRGDSLKGPFPKMGQELGGKQPSFAKGSLRRDDPFAKGKEKVGSEVSEAQLRGSMLKCGSKKLWNVLFPPSFGCRQGGRNRSEPLTLERLLSFCDALPKEDAFEVSKRCSGEGTSPTRGDADDHQRSHLKAPFLSKGKEKMRKFSEGEDKANLKGFVGFPHRGSSVTVFPSYPVTREKGLNSVGSCGVMVVENFESQYPMKPRVISEFFFKKNDDEAFCHGFVGNPNRDGVESQLASLNQLFVSFKSLKIKPNTPLRAPNLVTVSQGETEFSPDG
uniref:HTH myb-type domain-containing protein n=1 Tax=Vitis vinifera TaxID=29760 RepID=A5AP80_VITVI|nr:hypothetical protein VITISV_039149 [Vitis vinifera]